MNQIRSLTARRLTLAPWQLSVIAAAYIIAFSNSVSAKSYVRGSESRDTGIVLNGNALLEPYHVRNFQSLFSTIDSRAVDGIEVFSGNFPVQYGNQMGGMMVIDTIEPTAEGRAELGLSVFNTSVLSTGTVADSRIGWLVSARRGNLDLVIDVEDILRYPKPDNSKSRTRCASETLKCPPIRSPRIPLRIRPRSP